MPVNSRQKGKRGEREAVKFLKSLGFDARRTQQYSGTEGTSDVTCLDLPDWHIEVKYGYPKMDVASSILRAACIQSAADANGKQWCVLWKPKGCRQWRMTFGVDKRQVTIADDGAIKQCLSY